MRERSLFHGTLVLLLATFAGGSLCGQSGGSLNGHTVRLDSSNKLMAWPAVQEGAYDQVVGLATNFLLNGVPTAPNGLKLYYSESYANPGNPLTGAGWPHNPAGLYSMLTDSALNFYAYSGNAAAANLARDVLTYQLDHGMTPSTWHWPSVAYASSDAGALTYQGAQNGNSTGVGDGVGVIQPDKVGEIGMAFLKYYQFSGAVRFRDAAVQAADVLASHVRTGNATQSPWPFRVYAQTNVIREQYTAHVIAPIRLFDELARLNLGDVPAYQAARQTAWNWLMSYPIQNNAWATYFEDVAIRQNPDNLNQLVAGETARYLMQHPEFDPNWEAHARGILAWIEQKFAVPQFGANSIAEQQAFYFPMGSHTSRYASLQAQLYELTGDQNALEKAYRSFNWATYMCGTNGVVIDGPSVNHIWWTDGYGDYIKHFLAGMASNPQWAPAAQTHLLRSTSIVRSVQYAPGDVTYQVFDPSSQEVLRLNFVPLAVTADGVVLPKRSDLAQAGWTYDAATGVMRVRHDSGTQLRISEVPLSSNTPPVVTLDSPAPGTYVTPTSLHLAATASDPDGSIDHVEFLRNGLAVASVTAAPYEFTWTPILPGNYQLAAVAVDAEGARTTSQLVAVVVSTPTLPPVSVPDVSGLTQAAATSAITAVGLAVAVTSASSTTVPAGLVIGQNPLAGTSVVLGSAVNLVVSTGPPPPLPPTVTVTVTLTSIGARDGRVVESSETSNVGSNLSANDTSGSSIRVGDDYGDRQYKGIVSFDTSAIPDDATVTSVILQLTRGGGFGTSPFTTHGALNVDVQSGAFSGNVALEASDFQAAATAVGVASMSSVSSNGQVSSGSFDAAGLAAVNKTGTTQARLYFTLDDNDDGGSDYAGFYSGSNSTANNRPRLVVTYTSGSVPLAPTNVTAVPGNAQATVSWTAPASNGGSAITGYQLQVATAAGGTYANAAGCPTNSTTTTCTATGLVNGTSYFFKVASLSALGVGPYSTASSGVTPAPAATGLTVNASVWSDGTGTRTATLTTAGANRLILAFGSSDGPASGAAQTLTVSGGGLTWSLVQRVNTSLGSSEIWRAFASAPLSNASISLTQSQTNYHQSLTVVAFAGATGVGASNAANGASGPPTVGLTTTRAGSLVYGVGNDWDRAVARTVPADQTKVHEWVDTSVGDTFWVQARIAAVPAAGTAITLSDTAPTNDRWNFAIVEIVP